MTNPTRILANPFIDEIEWDNTYNSIQILHDVDDQRESKVSCHKIL